MHYSNIRSRAGLVALVFALIISLVSAVPIPSAESGLSSTLSLRSDPSLNGQREVDTARFRVSRLPSTDTRTFTRRQDISPNVDDQLVRRTSVGTKIKKAFQKVGSDIKHAAQKVGNFVKTTGAKVAKFGLKVVQSVGEVVGHAASFIPAIGKPIQAAIKGVTTVAGVASNSIHAKLSSKLQKGMNVMNKADKVMSYIPRRRDLSEEEANHAINKPEPKQQATVSKVAGVIRAKLSSKQTKLSPKLEKGMDVMNKADQHIGYVPRRRDLSEEEAFEQRDISEAYSSFEERDDIALENREESYFEANERDIYERYDLD